MLPTGVSSGTRWQQLTDRQLGTDNPGSRKILHFDLQLTIVRPAIGWTRHAISSRHLCQLVSCGHPS